VAQNAGGQKLQNTFERHPMPSRRGFFQWLSLFWGSSLLNSQGSDAVPAAVGASSGSFAAVAGSTSRVAAPTTLLSDERPIQRSYDLVIVGGGIAGVCAAISAARHGVQVALVHNRPMLGGNSSSEVKLYPENSTTKHPWIKEAGILEEICNEDRARNHREYREGTMNCVWDLVLYEWVYREQNIALYLNTHMHRAIMESASHIMRSSASNWGRRKRTSCPPRCSSMPAATAIWATAPERSSAGVRKRARNTTSRSRRSKRTSA
jgi:hypothetical protein